MKRVLILAPFLGLAFALDGDIGASDADSAACVSKGGSCDAKAGPTGDEVHLMQLRMQRKPARKWSYWRALVKKWERGRKKRRTPPPPPPPTGEKGTWSYKPLQWIPNLSSPFNITQCATIKNASGSLLPANVRASLATDKKNTMRTSVWGSHCWNSWS